MKNEEIKIYRICIITTMASSIDNWIRPLIVEYYKNNIHLTIVCNMSLEYKFNLKKEFPYITLIDIPIPRGNNFIGSIKSIWKLYRLFIERKFDLVQYSTPNASFYSSIAAYFAKISVRLYCQWGMVFVGMEGIQRVIFETIERIICFLSTEIQPDSHGNLNYCRKKNFYSDRKSRVIWNGSAKGVDLIKFDFLKKNCYCTEIRERYGINNDTFVIGFVGRLGRDKGCNELIIAYKILSTKYSNLKLLFVGPIEKENTINKHILRWFYSNIDIIKTNRVSDVEKHLAAMDVFILPSYREGFGMSIVEAEAMGVPVVVTKIPGPINGIIDGKTGVTIPTKDTLAIVEALEMFILDIKKRQMFGEMGVKFARENFDSKIFSQKVLENRMQLINFIYKKKIP